MIIKRSEKSNKSLFFSENFTNNEKLTRTDKQILSFIVSLSKQKGYCWATNRYIAYELLCSERTVSRAIKNLSLKNFIEIQNGKSFNRRIFLKNEIEKNVYEPRQNVYHMSNNINLRQRQLQKKQQDDRKKFTKEYFYQFLKNHYKGCINFDKEYEKIKAYLKKRNRSLYTLEQTLDYWIGRDKQSLYYKLTKKIEKPIENSIKKDIEYVSREEINLLFDTLKLKMRC